MLIYGVVLLHDNVCPHGAACTWAILEHLNWELFDHLPYNPEITPSIYHLFTYPKNWLGSQCVSNKEKLMEGVKMWLTGASVLAVTSLRSGLSMYVFFYVINIFSSFC
jgi:hypothetical protein